MNDDKTTDLLLDRIVSDGIQLRELEAMLRVSDQHLESYKKDYLKEYDKAEALKDKCDKLTAECDKLKEALNAAK
ncbi:hypothetical protein [Eubacterium sp.]|uniref:hypothetical protein n=1 Tax=Eubacterium sp. TaxID=142586 RepID=UPI002FC5969E